MCGKRVFSHQLFCDLVCQSRIERAFDVDRRKLSPLVRCVGGEFRAFASDVRLLGI